MTPSSRSFGVAIICACSFCVTVGCSKDPEATSIDALQNGDVNARRIAVRELANYDGDQVLETLAGAIDDPDEEVRRHAIHALAGFGPDAARYLPILVGFLEDNRVAIRLNAALAIQSIDPDSETYRQVLIDALRRGEGSVFLRVGKMGADGAWAVPTLVKILSDPEPRFRMLAAHTLGQLGPVAIDAAGALEQAMQDPNEQVRAAASESLDRIHAT